jgi:hypothetical protein
MLDRFQLPDVAAVARRTMLGALIVGVLGLVILLLLSQNWAALGLCIGIGLGIGNFRLIVRSVVKVGQRVEGNKRRPLAMNTLGRLMVMTVVALVLAWVEPPLGLGIIGGLAIFQFVLLANVTRSMLKAGAGGGLARGGLAGGGLAGGGLAGGGLAGGGLSLLFGSALSDAVGEPDGAAQGEPGDPDDAAGSGGAR